MSKRKGGSLIDDVKVRISFFHSLCHHDDLVVIKKRIKVDSAFEERMKVVYSTIEQVVVDSTGELFVLPKRGTCWFREWNFRWIEDDSQKLPFLRETELKDPIHQSLIQNAIQIGQPFHNQWPYHQGLVLSYGGKEIYNLNGCFEEDLHEIGHDLNALLFDFRQDTTRMATANDHIIIKGVGQVLGVESEKLHEFEWKTNSLVPQRLQEVERVIQSRLINRCVLRRLLRSLFVENASLVVLVDPQLVFWLEKFCSSTHYGICVDSFLYYDAEPTIRANTRLVCVRQDQAQDFQRLFQAKYPGSVLPNIIIPSVIIRKNHESFDTNEIGYDWKRNVAGLSDEQILDILENISNTNTTYSIAWVRREIARQLQSEQIIQQSLKSELLNCIGPFDGPVDVILGYCDVIDKASQI